jgi:hypothetical protein
MSEPVVAQKTPFVQKIEPAICWWCGCKNCQNGVFLDGSHNHPV